MLTSPLVSAALPANRSGGPFRPRIDGIAPLTCRETRSANAAMIYRPAESSTESRGRYVIPLTTSEVSIV